MFMLVNTEKMRGFALHLIISLIYSVMQEHECKIIFVI